MSDSTTDVEMPESWGSSADMESSPEGLNESPPFESIDSLNELRDLIFGQEVVDRVNDRMASFQLDAKNIANVLPEAIMLTQSQALVSAVRPTIEHAIKDSVNQEEEILADALFPIIGPATRKAVTSAIKTLADSLNQGIELSLSPQSIGWRIESWRTGRPFAEIVLLRTLLYQVEQVLLIHKETGLMLRDVVAETVSVQDPDLVSSMLTAIEDFVQDSFTTKNNSFLDSVEFGDLILWIEDGPQAVLACAIRGVPPTSLRPRMKETLEQIHRQYDPMLESFSGDRAPFEKSEPLERLLQNCLISQVKSQEKKRSPVKWIGGVLLIGLLLLIARATYVQYQWRSAVKALDQQPGITIVQARRGWIHGHIKGLRDPLTPAPQKLLASHGLSSSNIKFNFEPYWSLSPELVENQARETLLPPDTVQLKYDPHTLTLTAIGQAPYDWIQQAQQVPKTQPRIHQIDTSQLQVDESQQLQQLKTTIEQVTLDFEEGSSAFEPAQQRQLQDVSTSIRAITELAQQIRQPVVIHVLGQATPSGPAEDNTRLSQSRADLIVRRLVEMGIQNQYLKAEGIGVNSKFGDQLEIRKAQVSFRIDLTQR